MLYPEILSVRSGGFVKASITQDNLLILTSFIQKQLLLGKYIYLAMIAFKKVFNVVNHSVLAYEIIKSGWSGRGISYYKKCTAK